MAKTLFLVSFGLVVACGFLSLMTVEAEEQILQVPLARSGAGGTAC
jgi:hypothetical protein